MQPYVKKVVCVADISQYIFRVCERNAESSQTLITSPICLFQPFTYMGYYGYSWEFMEYNIRKPYFFVLFYCNTLFFSS